MVDGGVQDQWKNKLYMFSFFFQRKIKKTTKRNLSKFDSEYKTTKLPKFIVLESLAKLSAFFMEKNITWKAYSRTV